MLIIRNKLIINSEERQYSRVQTRDYDEYVVKYIVKYKVKCIVKYKVKFVPIPVAARSKA